ncbi:alpha-L-fucosidase [Kitasatospora azatica]|uniref:alpha-L-fucosidase n=1 Tax=Kitasatospora azatica TaxID=58347 RepID=UPI001E3B3AE6|nr:alpha-L-fucosidase [Kitasatospora azatica]
MNRRTVLVGLAVATVATVVGPGSIPAEAAVVEGDPLPLVPLRVPKLDQGTWQQPDSKIQWMRDNKLAMFIHWGVYSAPAHGEWYQFSAKTKPSDYRSQYAGTFASQSQNYNPAAWAQLAKDLGAAQVVLTTRHHEGFALWPSGHPNAWTAGDTPFPAGTDFVKGYVNAVRAAGLRVGVYYSPIDWRYPGYYDVSGAKPPSPALTSDCVLPNSLYPWNYEGTDPTSFDYHENARTMKNEVYQSVKELVTDYGAIDDVWWDGGWLAQQGTDASGSFFWEPGQYRDPNNGWLVDAAYGETEPSTGKPLGLTGLVRQHQPNAVANSRSGWVGDYDIEEGGYVSSGPIRYGRLVQKAFAISGTTWGYDGNNAISFSSAMAVFVNAFIRDMCVIVNVGPDATGTIPSAQAAVLRQVGGFMSANHEAVYSTRGGPWNPVEGQYGFTFANQTVYAHLLAGYSGGSSFTTPSLGDARVTSVYDVVSKSALSFSAAGGNAITVTGIDRTRYPDDTIVAIVLDRSVVPTDIARGATATADSVETAHGNLAANAVDGDTSTRWCAADGNTGHWLQVDLGSVRAVTGARIAWELPSNAYQFRIDGSTDGSTWSTLADRTGNTTVAQVQALTFTAQTRYVRVTVTGGVNSGLWASIRSLEVYDRAFLDPSLSGGDLALGRPASSSSNENSSLAAANAFDGNQSTRWSSQFSDPQWLQVDLGSTQTVGRVVLNWEFSHATAYQIQVSNDATNWTTVYSTTSGNGGVENISGLSGSGRYVRMLGTARATQWSYSLYSMQVFNS